MCHNPRFSPGWGGAFSELYEFAMVFLFQFISKTKIKSCLKRPFLAFRFLVFVVLFYIRCLSKLISLFEQSFGFSTILNISFYNFQVRLMMCRDSWEVVSQVFVPSRHVNAESA